MYKTYFKSHTKYILDRDRDDNKLHEGVKKFHETAKKHRMVKPQVDVGHR